MIERSACPSCGATEAQSVVAEAPYDAFLMREHLASYSESALHRLLDITNGHKFTLVRCNHCSLTYQQFVLDEETTAELYDQWLDPERGARHDAEKVASPLYAMQILEVIDHFRTSPAQLRLLDFGSGTGEWCRVAAGLGCQVWGADLSERRMNMMSEQVGYETIDVGQIDSSGPFDFVNLEQVAEHLISPFDVLKGLVDNLSIGGIIRVSVPNARDLDRRLDAWDWTAPKGTATSLNVVAPLQHVNAFTHESLLAIGARLGLAPLYRPVRQLKLSPLVGPIKPALRYALVRFYRAARKQDTQVWLRRTA